MLAVADYKGLVRLGTDDAYILQHHMGVRFARPVIGTEMGLEEFAPRVLLQHGIKSTTGLARGNT